MDLEGRVRTVFKVLIRHFLCSWQSAKTPGGGSFGHPRQKEFLSHTPSTVTSTVMTRMHVRSSVCAHSPLSGSSVNESCAQDTEQEHGKEHCFFFAFCFCTFFHFFVFFFFLNSFFEFFLHFSFFHLFAILAPFLHLFKCTFF